MDSCATESLCLVVGEQFAQRCVQYVSIYVVVCFVVAAREHFSAGGDDTSAPNAQTTAAAMLTVEESVLALFVPAVPCIGRHQRMPVRIIVQLCGLECQSVGSERAVATFHLRPFVFVGA